MTKKKDEREPFRFWVSAAIAVIALLISTWLTMENNKLKTQLRIQSDQIESVEKTHADQTQLMTDKNKEIDRLKDEIDSLKKLAPTKPTK